jgi:ATP-dependent Clp protease ATP-binding subunit ClpB
MSQTGFSTSHKIDTSRVSSRVEKLREQFAARLVGQTDATDALTWALENHESGIADPRRPLACLLFLGPTGTGKTSAVEAFAESLFGSRDAMVKIDCGEFGHSHEIAKLIGSPPGYLGHRETPPRLTQEALNQWHTEKLPISILLCDEIEKASDSLWNLLLGILDKAKVTLGDNRVTRFDKTIIVMTSNVGASQMATMLGDNTLGFSGEKLAIADSKMKDIAMSAARKRFSPEFLNRMDQIVMFNTLTLDEVREIIGIELGYIQQKLFTRFGSSMCPSPAALKEILAQGYDTKYNARNIRRVIERKIASPISRAFGTGEAHKGQTIIVDAVDGKFEFHAEGHGINESLALGLL